MNIEDILFLRKIWYFYAYITPGCCQNLFIKSNQLIKTGFGEIKLVVSLQCYFFYENCLIKCESDGVFVIFFFTTRFFYNRLFLNIKSVKLDPESLLNLIS